MVLDQREVTSLPLGRRPRLTRFLAAILGLVLITAGTVFGTDDDFPVGPLRMYSVRDDPNGTVTQAVVVATTADGRHIDVTDTTGAPRRAELEGRFARLSERPAGFRSTARAFLPHSGRLGGSPVVEITLIERSYPLHNGRSGLARDRVVATWAVPA